MTKITIKDFLNKETITGEDLGKAFLLNLVEKHLSAGSKKFYTLEERDALTKRVEQTDKNAMYYNRYIHLNNWIEKNYIIASRAYSKAEARLHDLKELLYIYIINNSSPENKTLQHLYKHDLKEVKSSSSINRFTFTCWYFDIIAYNKVIDLLIKETDLPDLTAFKMDHKELKRIALTIYENVVEGMGNEETKQVFKKLLFLEAIPEKAITNAKRQIKNLECFDNTAGSPNSTDLIGRVWGLFADTIVKEFEEGTF